MTQLVDEAALSERYLDTPVRELPASPRLINVLCNDNRKTLRDVLHMSEGDLLRTPHFGRKLLHEVHVLLSGNASIEPPVGVDPELAKLMSATVVGYRNDDRGRYLVLRTMGSRRVEVRLEPAD